MFGTSRFSTRALSLVLPALLASGCGSAVVGAATGDLQGVSVTVTPTTSTVYPSQAVPLAAAVTGTADTSVTWSIVQGAAGGTISATGLYTAPSATGVFHVLATSRANPAASGSATVNVTSTPPPADGPMTTANRTSGVAPLAVFFDAVDTSPAGAVSPFSWSSGIYQPADYEGTQYSWDFGDPNSGTWSQTGNSRNRATGYTAAHVYENPGTYTTNLTITELSGTTHTYSQTITVSAFAGTTYYVAANGSDSASGTSTSAALRTVDRAMAVALATSGPVQILFRRGDAFTTAGQWNITKAGPGIIGAYGSGNRPVITCSFDNGSGWNIFQFYQSAADWRVMDLEMHPTSTSATTGPAGPPVESQGVNMLLLRLKAVDFNDGIGWGDWTPIYTTPHDGMFVVESESTSPSGTYEAYVGGRRIALMGNYFHDTGSSHVLRVWQAVKGVISNNQLARPGGQRHALKLHGPQLNDGRPETRWVSITDNVFRASSTSQWTVSMGSQSEAASEADPVTHVVFERNLFTGSSSLVADLETEARNVIVRNNVFDDSLGNGTVAIIYSLRNPSLPAPSDVRIYNNTIYTTNAISQAFSIGAEVSNCRVRNNLFASPAGGTLIGGGGGSGWAADHNLLSSSPGFTGAAGGDFSLASGSPAANQGATLTEVREDFNRVARPVGTAYDVGAFESW